MVYHTSNLGFTEYQLLFKYQHYYDIWNDDGSFNKLGFDDFLADIVEGLA
jgi:hypothetical protein